MVRGSGVAGGKFMSSSYQFFDKNSSGIDLNWTEQTFYNFYREFKDSNYAELIKFIHDCVEEGFKYNYDVDIDLMNFDPLSCLFVNCNYDTRFMSLFKNMIKRDLTKDLKRNGLFFYFMNPNLNSRNFRILVKNKKCNWLSKIGKKIKKPLKILKVLVNSLLISIICIFIAIVLLNFTGTTDLDFIINQIRDFLSM